MSVQSLHPLKAHYIANVKILFGRTDGWMDGGRKTNRLVDKHNSPSESSSPRIIFHDSLNKLKTMYLQIWIESVLGETSTLFSFSPSYLPFHDVASKKTRKFQNEECDPHMVFYFPKYVYNLILICFYRNFHERKYKFCFFFTIFFSPENAIKRHGKKWTKVFLNFLTIVFLMFPQSLLVATSPAAEFQLTSPVLNFMIASYRFFFIWKYQ